MLVCFIKYWLLLFPEFDLAHTADKTFICCISITFHYFGLLSCQHLEIYNSSALCLARIWILYISLTLVTSPIAGRVRETERRGREGEREMGSGRSSHQKAEHRSICFTREQGRNEKWSKRKRGTFKRVKQKGTEKMDSVYSTQIKACLDTALCL